MNIDLSWLGFPALILAFAFSGYGCEMGKIKELERKQLERSMGIDAPKPKN